MLSDWPIDAVLLLLVLAAMVLAPVTALLVRWRYKASVLKLMRSSSGRVREQRADLFEIGAEPDEHLLTIETRAPSGVATISRSMAMYGVGYFLAGLAHALVSTLVWFTLSGVELLPVRGLIVWLVFATPAIFSTLYVIGIGQLRILLGAVVWLVMVMVLAVPFSADALVVLLLPYLVALPIAMGLLLVNRKVGTIAPFLVVPAMLLVLGALLSLPAAMIGLQMFETSGAIYGAGALSLVAGLVGGWIYLAIIARQYERSKVSELMLQNDVLWFLVSTTQAIPLMASYGWSALAMFLPFVVYRLVLTVCAKFSRPSVEPSRLLFLRVFGFQTRQAEFHRVFLNAWRRKGPVALIGAPDIALDTIDPPELFAFVSGNLRRLFVEDSASVRTELEKPPSRSADGLYPLDDFYCFEDTWQPSVEVLIDASSWVVMDLRGFDDQNMGCIYEIGELFKRTPTEHLVFLVDKSTDKPFLQKCMKQAWAKQAKAAQQATVVLWEIDSVKALRRLTRQLLVRTKV